MKTDEIYTLLNAFYNGDTTVEQEQALLAYFESGDVAAELIPEKEIFLGMYRPEPVEVPPALEATLGHLVDKLARDENKKASEKPQRSTKRLLMWVSSAAACIALLISATFYFNRKPPVEQLSEVNAVSGQVNNLSEEDKQTLKEAQKALMLLSSNFNKGVGQLAIVSSSLDKTNEILNKTFNRKKNRES
jgi:hypothetical protein